MGQKILALASQPISGEALRSAIGDAAAADAEVLVVAPALNTKLRHFFADPDAAIDRAGKVATESSERLEEEEIDAVGKAGESDPLLALQDALATYRADQIVLFTHSEGERNWLEEGIVDKAKEQFAVPVIHFVVEGSGQDIPLGGTGVVGRDDRTESLDG